MLICVCWRNSTASAESNAATWSTDKFETIDDFDMAQAAPATAAELLPMCSRCGCGEDEEPDTLGDEEPNESGNESESDNELSC